MSEHRNETSAKIQCILQSFCHQVEPDDDNTEQNNAFVDKTISAISSDDIPVTQVPIVDEVSTFLCLSLDDLT